MHPRWRKARATALATGVAAALTAGAVVPAGAAGRPTTERTGSASAAPAGDRTWITLITGDQVAVDTEGRPVALKRAEGRGNIPVQIRRQRGHVYVVPQDAVRLIAQGRVDRRLFDVTTLSRAEYREAAERRGLGLIVTYRGGRPEARAELHQANGTEVTHTFKALGGESVTAPVAAASGVWTALTNEAPGSPYATAESGLRTVWLNAIQKAAAEPSWNTRQIHAPDAWDAGYDGSGVTIAVLDTGVDKSHPDLTSRVVAEKNFSTADNLLDHFGHGTHVASIAAGTGEKSAGAYKGVASGAHIISGKVLGDDGFGDDAGIIAGLEWAAASGAKVANLSLGGGDTPGVDPIEEAVNRLSADTGTLFVIAAGNEGDGDSTVGSPGSADAALTVGAVDKDSKLADFSSRGPRVGDGAVKPDVTAPGVDITAAAAKGSVIDTDPEVPHTPDGGYLTISGTSMATPHVAGAAAILAQEHPDWAGPQIKAALVGSTADGGYTAFQQGSGQIDLARAIHQDVVAEPVSLSFGVARWPHADDVKQSKTITYRNSGTSDVTLDLSVTGRNPKGAAAPKGFFTLDKQQVTVPAGGTAEATLTADTTLGGTVDGAYSAAVMAGDGTRSVRTAAGVVREAESYDLRITNLDRDGRPAADYDTLVAGLDVDAFEEVTGDSSSTVLRLPKGSYAVDSLIVKPAADGRTLKSANWVSRPLLKLTKDTELTLDASKAKPFAFTLPDRAAKQADLAVGYNLEYGDTFTGLSFNTGTLKDFRTAHSGPALSAAQYQASVSGLFEHGSKVYTVAYGRTKSFYTGYTRTVKSADLAKITTTAGSPAKYKLGVLFTIPFVNEAMVAPSGFLAKLPFTRTVYVNGSGVTWAQDFMQTDASGQRPESFYDASAKTFTKGKSYSRTFNVGVFGPKLDKYSGLYRSGDEIFGSLALFADGKGHSGYSSYDKAATTLYRDGKMVGTYDVSLDDGAFFTVKRDKADYRLTTSVTRSKPAAVSTRITASWTFSSQHVADDALAALPVSVVRFTPSLSATSTAKAKATVKVPVTVQGPAAGRNLKSLKVYVSTDGGAHWSKLIVKSGKVTLKNPKAGKGVSFKALVGDKKGNTLSQVIYNAYLAK
ncbi:S8 family serine peptidase [Streptomyces sp. NPDC026673]|uniref:S8 family peptidase n=1 Tax=Streptomyces sp. NPDC026673 TaxID=3155724 RepID=UPI0033EB16C2